MGLLDSLRSRFIPKPDPYLAIQMANTQNLANAMLKAFALPDDLNARYDEAPVKKVYDWDTEDAWRRAIDPISNSYNTLGIYRSDFDKSSNDSLAKNAYFAVMEKSMIDYICNLPWEVSNKDGKEWSDAMEWLERPNPQQGYDDILRISLRDIIRYDAGAWVKTFNLKKELVEMKAYMGTEFWKETDRMLVSDTNDVLKYTGYWSHGYTKRYWQRSRTGIYTAFDPNEIVYLMMYPRSDGIYGTDYITSLKYQLQYLIDSTRAAGKTFANGVVPSLVWSHPQIFDRNQLYQRMQEVKNENQGSYRFGGILHTVREEKVETLAHTLHDMEWLEGQRFVAQMIWAMWGFQTSEFIESGNNRSTAYIGRNITKSKMLYPMMKFIETRMTKEVLPYLPGWKKGYSFKFIRELDLDDELKSAQIQATKVQSASMLIQMGMKAEDALKLTNITDNPNTLDIEDMRLTMAPGGQQNNKPGAIDAVPGKIGPGANYKDKTPDQEDRQAGVTKADRSEINLSSEDIMIKLIFKDDPAIISNRNETSMDIAREIAKEGQEKMHHDRTRMAKPDNWRDIVDRYKDKYNLEET